MILRIFLLLTLAWISSVNQAAQCPDYLNQTLKKLHSTKTLNICETYAGKPLLIVNTASHCGFTSQFQDLEKLHQRYKDKGLVILGFASDDFKQEAKNEEEIAKVCYRNFGVTFDMFAPIVVTGDQAHPIFKALAEQAGAPRWNFYKYLLNAEGKVVESFSSMTNPSSSDLSDAIDKLLKKE